MQASKRNLYILTFILFVAMLGYGIIIPILPFYIENMGAGGLELGLLVASYAVMRLIFGPIWGELSDRIGRKPVLLIGIFGFTITMIWFGFATQLWMLFLARILSGVLSSATAPTTMAYIGDSTPDEERGGGMGLLGAAGGIGTIIGPVLGGFLATKTLATPFFIAAAFSVVSLILAVIFLPESNPIPDQISTKGQKTSFNPRSMWVIMHSPIGVLFILTFISTCGVMIFANVFGLYSLEKFNYGPDEIGIIMMVLGLVSALTQGLLVGPLTKKFGDESILKSSLFATSISFILLLPANNSLTVILTTAIFGLTVSLQIPALTALTSRRATFPQGIAMGMSNSFISLGRIVGPIIGGMILDINLNLPYLCGAAVMLVGFIGSIFWIKPERQAFQAI